MVDFNEYIIRLRGLPWTVAAEDVIDFLDDCCIDDLHMMFNSDGRPKGEAYVELNSREDFNTAISKHRAYLGNRYIDITQVTRSEMDFNIKKNNAPREVSSEDAVVKLRGLPYSCDKDTLIEFFDNLPVTSNGVFVTTDSLGRATGDAYVQFSSQAYADIALKKHKERIGHRYIEIYKSTLAEARAALSAAAKAGRAGTFKSDDRKGTKRSHDDYESDRRSKMRSSNFISQTGYSVHMRGLPYSTSEADIAEFFYPLTVNRVVIEMNYDGRPSGNANVDFNTREDAAMAMKKDRESVKHRYVELFYTGRHDDKFR